MLSVSTASPAIVLRCQFCKRLLMRQTDKEVGENPIEKVASVPLRDISHQAKKGCRFCITLNSAIKFACEIEPKFDESGWAIKRFRSYGRFCSFAVSPLDSTPRVTFELFEKDVAGDRREWSAVRDYGIIQRPKKARGFVAAEGSIRKFQDWKFRRIINNGSFFSTVNCINPNSRAYAAVPVRLSLPSETSHEDCFKRIRAWQSYCKTNHVLCSRNKEATLPSRVVEITTTGGEPQLRLYESQVSQQEYVALSHRWGNPSTIFQTNKQNIKAQLRRIPYSELSNTFQEAVQATQKLGYTYLWLDSLCIIQDDAEDWRREASKMADIFQNASIVLSAASSVDGTGGLFRKRLSGQEMLVSSTPSGQEIMARRKIDHSFCMALAYNPASPSFAFRDHPLMARKWCFQERIIASRIVHFTSHELVWECNEEAFCECGHPNAIANGSANNAERLQSDKVQLAKELYSHAEWHDLSETQDALFLWQKLVIRYTGARLTFATDILPAISGVAQTFAEKSLGKYLAGMWQHGLAIDLCWTIDVSAATDISESGRSLEYCAPSWSWASVKDVVRFFILHRERHKHVERQCVEIIDADCTSAGIDPYGQVSGGLLKISAPASQLKVLGFSDNSEGLSQLCFEGWNVPQFCYIDTSEDERDISNHFVWTVCIFRRGNLEGQIGLYLILRGYHDGSFQRIGLLLTLPEYEAGSESFASFVDNSHKHVFWIT